MLFSILIATHNRKSKLEDSLSSAIQFCKNCGQKSEIIVVNDASTDDTAAMFSQKFLQEQKDGVLQYLELKRNVGVTAARMAGLPLASGQWIVIYDSDDRMVGKADDAVKFAALLENQEHGLIFTRCISQTKNGVIGAPLRRETIFSLSDFVNHGTPGECMPAIRRDVMQAIPYDPTLRAFESLTMARQMARYGPALLSPLAVRLYHDEDTQDRLSSFAMRRRRANDLARGFAMMLQEFWGIMHWRARAMYALRYSFYKMLALLPSS